MQWATVDFLHINVNTILTHVQQNLCLYFQLDMRQEILDNSELFDCKKYREVLLFALLKLSRSVETKLIYNLHLFVSGVINSSLHQGCLMLSVLYG